jgi:hypothetical protein
LAGVCRSQLSGTAKSILGRGEHRRDRVGAVCASDVSQFCDIVKARNEGACAKRVESRLVGVQVDRGCP